MADAQGILQRVFDDGAQALRVLLGGTVAADAPSSPVEGDFWYESDTGSFFVRVGGSWVEIAAGTGTLPGLSDVTVTAVADNEVLAYDSGTGEWINQTAAEAGLVAKADYDAQTILAATSDNTPAALTVAEQRLVGRITGGNIDDLTPAQVRTLLEVPDGYTETDMTGDLKDLFGGTIDLGTDGQMFIWWREWGGGVDGWLFIEADTDATFGSGGPLYITGTDLPVTPADPPARATTVGVFGMGGGFGFFSDNATWQYGATPAIVSLGFTAMVFTLTADNAGGLSAIASDSNPQDLTTGVAWAYQGRVAYPAA